MHAADRHDGDRERQLGGRADRGARVGAACELVGDGAAERLLHRAEQEHRDQEHPRPQRADGAERLGAERARGEHVEHVREHARRQGADRHQRGIALVDRLQARTCRGSCPERGAGVPGPRSRHPDRLGDALLAQHAMPGERLLEALLERAPRLEAEQALGLRQVRHAVADVLVVAADARRAPTVRARSGPAMPIASCTLRARSTIAIGWSLPMLMTSPDVSGRASARTMPSTVSLT